MAMPHAKPGVVLDVRPLGDAISRATTTTLVKTDTLEVIRIVMQAGKTIAQHQVPGEITVQCLEGNVEFHVGAVKLEMTAGNFLYLDGNNEHSLLAKDDSSLLVTILLTHKRSAAK